MKELLISFLLALLVSSMINSCMPPVSSTPPPGASTPVPADPSGSEPGPDSAPAPAGQITAVSEDNFNQVVLRSSLPVLVEFEAKGSAPCKSINPDLERLAGEKKDRLRVVRVDVEENKQLFEEYAQGGLPTLVLFKGGKSLEIFTGYTDKKTLAAGIEHYL